jgi:hypothetical protein
MTPVLLELNSFQRGYPIPNKDTDDSVRKCRELFDVLKEISGSDAGAVDLWKDAFWIGFDGHTPPVISDEEVSEFAGWLNGATAIVNVLKARGYFNR